MNMAKLFAYNSAMLCAGSIHISAFFFTSLSFHLISWFIDIGVNDNEEQQENTSLRVQRLYDGLKIFTELCYLPQNQLIFPLNNGQKNTVSTLYSFSYFPSGDTVLWANTRLLHARRSLIWKKQYIYYISF
jgi:hypothetical protein